MRETQSSKECREAYENYRRRYVIQDVVPDAVWDFPIIRPEKPKHITRIQNFGKPKSERKFPYYSKAFINEMEELGRSSDKQDGEKFNTFVAEEWRRRYEGFFFFNGDILEYITGHHYCTLQYWKIQASKEMDGVYRKGRYQPDFRDAQRDVFYFMDNARRDNKCAGLAYISGRRSGKTNSALAEGYWDTTENVEAIFAIQSKTLDDGRKQFKKVVDTWKFIPYWFKPEDTGDTTQSNKLYFGEKKQSGKDIKERAYREVLNSIIYPENSKEAALDGEYVSYYFGDELGKSQKGLDIYERWNITRECLFDGNRIVGFAMNVSTVEDMDKYGSESFKLLWDKSDAKKRLPNGLTETYLYQLFLPAYYGYVGEDNNNVSFVDEWGYSNVDAAKRYHKKQYEARSGNSLLSYQRKYPLSIQDCWVTTDGKNNFSTSRLIEQKIWNDDTSYQDVVHGNFMWKNGIKWGEVDFYPCPVHEARWQVAWMPNESDRNRFETYLGGQKKPTRSFCVTGIDPFSHGKVVDEKQGSNGAAVTILKSYPGSTIKEGVVCLYNHRQPDANLQVEDYIMQAIFYSSPVLAESNVSVVVNGFQDKGFYGFLEYNPLETDLRKRGRGLKGFATTSAENVENLISMSASYILDNVGRQENGTYGFVPFNDLIQQWLDFTPDKRTPFDLVIAAGLAIILLRAKRQRTENNIPKESFFPKISKEGYAKLSSMVRRKDPIDDFN